MDPDEIRWIKSTANELNNLLQVLSDSSKFLEARHGGQPESDRYFAILRGGLMRATNVTRAMGERVGGFHPEIVSGTPALTVLPSASSAAGNSASTAVKIANPEGPRELLLIVDDEDFVTMLAERVLVEDGYRVVTARDGFQALEIYRKLGDAIALVILDFTMPVMDGSDVFHELMEIDPHVPVVLSSGFTEQESLRAMLAKGMRGFIPKPYTQEKLLTQVRAILDALQSEKTGTRRVL